MYQETLGSLETAAEIRDSQLVMGKSVRSARSLLLALSLIFTLYSLLGMFQMGKSWEAFLRVSRGNERKALI